MKKEYQKRQRRRRRYRSNRQTIFTSVAITFVILLAIGALAIAGSHLIRPFAGGAVNEEAGSGADKAEFGEDEAYSDNTDALLPDSDKTADSLPDGKEPDRTADGGTEKPVTDMSGETGPAAPKETKEPLSGDTDPGGSKAEAAQDPEASDGSDDKIPAGSGSVTADNSGSDGESDYSFENTLFIGDSRTEGLLINTGLTDATFYAVRGLAVDNIYTKQFITAKGSSGKLTVFDALKKQSFRKIYIMLGVNELGWPYSDVFIEKYAQLIEDIKTLQPETEIIIQSILPVTKKKSDGDKIYNNKKIYEYNELLEAMCAEEEVTYADLLPAIVDDDGALPEKGAVDGVHLTKSYYLKWLDYLISQKF